MFQDSIAAKFMEKLVDWCRNIKISDPLEEGCRLGPVVSKGQVKGLLVELFYLVSLLCLKLEDPVFPFLLCTSYGYCSIGG